MADDLVQHDPSTTQIGGYDVISVLRAGQSWLACAGDRRVVLKVLDEDCLWKSQLHPSIKDRLGRVREIAHVGVANLHGVERDGDVVCLVWEFVDGVTFVEHAMRERLDARAWLNLAREMILQVEILHSRGIIHGAIKTSNVIVNTSGQVVLTHVSPLLYTEPADDVAALIEVLNESLRQRGESETPAGKLLAQASEDSTPRELAAKLTAAIEARSEVRRDESDEGESKRLRTRSILGAALALLAGIILFLAIWDKTHRSESGAVVRDGVNSAARGKK